MRREAAFFYLDKGESALDDAGCDSAVGPGCDEDIVSCGERGDIDIYGSASGDIGSLGGHGLAGGIIESEHGVVGIKAAEGVEHVFDGVGHYGEL